MVCLIHYHTHLNEGESFSSTSSYSHVINIVFSLYLMKERVCLLHYHHIGVVKRLTLEQNFKLSTWLSFIITSSRAHFHWSL